ncbi:MAG: hypothetical protein R3A79_30725 [Nannocystaceae bacterium]
MLSLSAPLFAALTLAAPASATEPAPPRAPAPEVLEVEVEADIQAEAEVDAPTDAVDPPEVAAAPAEGPALEVAGSASAGPAPALTPPPAVVAAPAGEVSLGPPAEPTDPSSIYDGGIRWTLGSRQQHWLRMITWHQLWTRYTELNPGSEVNGEAREHQFDVGLRRSRILFLGNIDDRFQILAHFGINNQTFNNARKPQLFIHDATAQVRVFRDYLWVGGGLHYWHGISRMTNTSTLSLLGVDAPIINWPTIERTDQFARNLGLYAKGKIGLFDYRVALNKPFVPGMTVDPELEAPVGAADYDPHNNTVELASYVMFQLFDPEANTLPYATGTYLGTKRVLNLGGGIQWHPDAMWSQTEAGEVSRHDLFAAAVDVFADLPFAGERGALTAYGVYYYYDFGPNHLRSLGIMNVATGGSTLTGPGNATPLIGSGHHFYGQSGYMLPQKWTGRHRLQPYAASQVSRFEALDDVAWIPEVGLNWHLLGHHVKLTATYRNRPIFDVVGERKEVVTRRSEAILQGQIFF